MQKKHLKRSRQDLYRNCRLGILYETVTDATLMQEHVRSQYFPKIYKLVQEIEFLSLRQVVSLSEHRVFTLYGL